MAGSSGELQPQDGSTLARVINNTNGKCSTCSKNAMNASVSCLMCKVKFHAHDCSADQQDICNASFYRLFKPLSDKSGNNSHRPGNFKFVCDNCLTAFEVQQVATTENKLAEIENKFVGLETKLETSLNEIKLMISGPGANNTNVMHSTDIAVSDNSTYPVKNLCNNFNNAWADGGKSGIVLNTLQNTLTSILSDANKSSTNPLEKNSSEPTTAESILVINKNDDDLIDKKNMKTINKTMIKEKVVIRKSFKNKRGNTVFVCDSLENRNKLRDQIVKSVPDVSFNAPPPLHPVVAIVGFDKDCTPEEVEDALKHQNHFISNFLDMNKASFESHLSHLVTKPLKNNPELLQALYRVSPALRTLLKKFNDRLTIGSTCCRVYERSNVKRCNRCFKFGHFAAQCQEDTPTCGFCSQPHDTRDCPIRNIDSSIPVCSNCTHSSVYNHDVNHPAFSYSCPVFKDNLNQQR